MDTLCTLECKHLRTVAVIQQKVEDTITFDVNFFHPPLSLTEKAVVVFVNRPHWKRQTITHTVTAHHSGQLLTQLLFFWKT